MWLYCDMTTRTMAARVSVHIRRDGALDIPVPFADMKQTR